MILEIFIQNYKSLKDRVQFSLLAESTTKKENNVASVQLQENKTLRVLKAAAIFGHNASGKSNIMQACYEIIKYITNTNLDISDKIDCFSPFLFDSESRLKPTSFEIKFLGSDSIRYTYAISFTDKEVCSESLDYYPNNKITNIFKRSNERCNEDLIHEGILGSSWKNEKIKLYKNQSMIAKCGKDFPNEIIANVFMYFKSIVIVNAANVSHLNTLRNFNAKYGESSSQFKIKMNQLLRYCDIALEGVEVRNEASDESEKSRQSEKKGISLFGLHKSFGGGGDPQHVIQLLNFEEESKGTQAIYSIGGAIIRALEHGGVIFIDEFQTSLHPFISKILLELFIHSELNVNNAQLIFTSHESTLLSRDVLRRDQIWFTEKNEMGITDLFNLYDFDEVRDESPYDRWYLMGKIGAVGTFGDIKSIFNG